MCGSGYEHEIANIKQRGNRLHHNCREMEKVLDGVNTTIKYCLRYIESIRVIDAPHI